MKIGRKVSLNPQVLQLRCSFLYVCIQLNYAHSHVDYNLPFSHSCGLFCYYPPPLLLLQQFSLFDV